MATTLLRCAACRDRLHPVEAVYPVPTAGPCHPGCADRYWDAIATVIHRRPA